MTRCNCKTQDGKGPRCTRNAQINSQFCHQHQYCQYLASKSPSALPQFAKPLIVQNRNVRSPTKNIINVSAVIKLYDSNKFIIPQNYITNNKDGFARALTHSFNSRIADCTVKRDRLGKERLYLNFITDEDIRNVILLLNQAGTDLEPFYYKGTQNKLFSEASVISYKYRDSNNCLTIGRRLGEGKYIQRDTPFAPKGYIPVGGGVDLQTGKRDYGFQLWKGNYEESCKCALKPLGNGWTIFMTSKQLSEDIGKQTNDFLWTRNLFK
jgi:hypothetical protein